MQETSAAKQVGMILNGRKKNAVKTITTTEQWNTKSTNDTCDFFQLKLKYMNEINFPAFIRRRILTK